MDIMVNRNPEKTLNLFPFNGARWLTGYIKHHSIDPTDLVCYACRNLLKYLVWEPRPIGGHGILRRNWAQNNRVAICAAIPLNANASNIS
jgi:hypothetical protein